MLKGFFFFAESASLGLEVVGGGLFLSFVKLVSLTKGLYLNFSMARAVS